MAKTLDEKLNQCDQMSDHLFETWKKFVDNVDGKNGGKKSAIDIDLIMTEVKLTETLGRQAMLHINAGNYANRVISMKNKHQIEK
jgi:hypothetical protein